MVQRAAEILSGCLQAILQDKSVGQHVRLVWQLDQAVGVLSGHAQRSARAMVFERAREQKATIGQQCAGNAVALQALIRFAIEAEGERLVAIDQQAHGLGQAGWGGHPAISLDGRGAKSIRAVNISRGSKVRMISSLPV